MNLSTKLLIEKENILQRKEHKISLFVYHWLNIHRNYIKKSTYGTYISNIENHILPYFGNMNLEDITIEMNQNFIIYLCQKGRIDGMNGLSVKMTKDIMGIWLSILKQAKEEKIITLEDYRYKYPKSEKNGKKQKCLTMEQEIQIMDFLLRNPTPKNIGIMMVLSTGMRIGEICALRWKNIDLEKQEIHITATLQRICMKKTYNETLDTNKTTEIVISSPKSDNSIRTIPLADYLLDLLTPLKRTENSFFLTCSEEKWMEPRTYRDYYTRALKKQNLLFVTFHGLRHTFATRCIEAGCDYKTVSELLGHADVETTLRLYVHSDMEQKRECIRTMHNKYKKTIFSEME